MVKRKDIMEMGGLAKRMPLTMMAFALASLSMIGVPPVSGFVTKWYLAIGAMDIPLVITGIFSVAFGLYPDLFLNIIGVVDTNFFANILEKVTGS